MTVGQVDKEISVANQTQRVVMGVSILRYWYIDTRMSIDRVLITLIKYRSGQLLDCVKCVYEQYILKLLNAKYLSCFLVGLKISQSIVSNKKNISTRKEKHSRSPFLHAPNLKLFQHLSHLNVKQIFTHIHPAHM